MQVTFQRLAFVVMQCCVGFSSNKNSAQAIHKLHVVTQGLTGDAPSMDYTWNDLCEQLVPCTFYCVFVRAEFALHRTF